MACDSENMEIFHIFWRQTIDGDMMWLSISCKEVFLFDYVEGVPIEVSFTLLPDNIIDRD